MKRSACMGLIAGWLLGSAWAAPAVAEPVEARTTPAATAQTWGLFAEMVDRPFIEVLVDPRGDWAFAPVVAAYTWDVPGQVMAISTSEADGRMKKRATLRWDAARNAVVSTPLEGGREIVMLRQPDGSFVGDDGGYRRVQRRLADGIVELRLELDGQAGPKVLQHVHRVPATPEAIATAKQRYEEWKQIRATLPATPAVSKEVAAWNALNARYLAAVLNQANSASGGWWLSDTGEALSYEMQSDNSLTRTTLTAKPGGGVSEAKATIRANEATGVIAEMFAGRAAVFRVDSQVDGLFLIHHWPAAGADQGKKKNLKAVRVTPDKLSISKEHGWTEYRWASRAQVMHFLAPESPGSTVHASDRQRWGLYLDLIGREWIGYVPGSGAGNSSIWSVYEWAVPGEELRTYAVGNGRRVFVAITKWDQSSKRLVSTDAVGKVLGHSDVLSDGSIVGRGEFTQSRVRKLRDGLFESTTTGGTSSIDLSGTQLMFERSNEGIAALSRLQAADKAEAKAERREILAAQAAREQAESDRYFDAMRALNGVLAEANAVADARLQETQAEYDATMAQARRQAEYERAQVGAQGGEDAEERRRQAENARQATERQYETARQYEAQRQAREAAGQQQAAVQQQARQVAPQQPKPAGEVAGPGAPLRFVLAIGMQPRNGDTVNPTCYSNVITRPGPPGWGQRGFLPSGSAASARATVEGFRSRFIAACRAASGRDVTSEGDFYWKWNETRDGDQQVDSMRARYREDVTVNP